jgi:8-oxo-dGTP pyrophosphatase MutT (NUDIX family)
MAGSMLLNIYCIANVELSCFKIWPAMYAVNQPQGHATVAGQRKSLKGHGFGDSHRDVASVCITGKGCAIKSILNHLNSPEILIPHIRLALARHVLNNGLRHPDPFLHRGTSAVVMALSQACRTDRHNADEVCLTFNKRSARVRQPGDLCYPGGRVSPQDRIFAAMLRLPGSALHQWPFWKLWRQKPGIGTHQLAVLLAAGLREAWEEMRLCPLRVKFLGPLPAQKLSMFRRRICPLVCWVTSQRSLKPNWEVERIVHIPLKRLFDPDGYRGYRISFKGGDGRTLRKQDFPCFVHTDRQADEVLWGATYRITMDFLKIAFDFEPPAIDGLPIVTGRLGQAYLAGSLLDGQ